MCVCVRACVRACVCVDGGRVGCHTSRPTFYLFFPFLGYLKYFQ